MGVLPFDPGEDLAAMADGLDDLTVTRTDPDDGSALAAGACSGLRSAVRLVTIPAAGGEVGSEECDWELCGDPGFTPSDRDVIEEPDGTRWRIGDVHTEGTLHWCPGCVKLRS